jgi:nicotinate-nucleotide adenylyltransferase
LELAIFGGTFDPIHNAHLAAARAARDTFHLDRILLIPNAIPPHKQDSLTASYENRLAMVRLAAAGERRVEASDLEAGTGKSYSIHTIERLAATLDQSDQLYFIIGADAFAEIRTWYRWQDVIARVTFIVVSRPGHEWDIPEHAQVRRLDQIYMEVSSSAIRTRLALCQQPPELPEPVFQYIRQHALYGYGSACGQHPQLPLTADPVSG